MDRLGDFEIEGVLGEGGSAIVYAARRGGEEMALKVLRPDLLLSEREVGAFLAEAHRAQRVAHPSLVEIRDAGVLPDGRPYLAMPRLRGECLADRVARGPIDLERAIRLFHGLAGAVSALHAAGLVHRDIKPENMFVVGDGEEHVVLLDLGIARDIDAPASTTTQAGLVRGTPAYMAPERFFGARASTLTDTYEAAVTLYVMLTGRLPWDPNEARGRMSPRDPRSVVPLPEPVAKALLRALSIDETARPESVRALHDELEQAAVSTADTKLVAVTSGGAHVDPALPSGGVRAISIRPPGGTTLPSAGALAASDLATQDTVALSTGRVRRRGGPAWAPAVMSACVLAGAAAGAWAFLIRAPASDAPSAPTAEPAGVSTPSEATAAQAAPPPVTAAPEVPSTATAEAPAAGTTATASESAVPAATPSAAPPRPAGSTRPRPTAAAPASATATAVPGQRVNTGAVVPQCVALLGVACSPEYKAIDHGNECRRTQATLQSTLTAPESELPLMNSACRGAWMAAVQVIAEKHRAQAQGKP